MKYLWIMKMISILIFQMIMLNKTEINKLYNNKCKQEEINRIKNIKNLYNISKKIK